MQNDNQYITCTNNLTLKIYVKNYFYTTNIYKLGYDIMIFNNILAKMMKLYFLIY